MSSILVGLDLSPSSRAALPWAAEQARLTGQRLLAVNGAAGCWHSRACGLSPAGLGFGEPLLPESREMHDRYRARRQSRSLYRQLEQPTAGLRN
jgi:hypothetical protein